ncbi:MAG: UDP-N-acetylglucosamine 2-epimerase (hydrolyzing) [Alphaproteobacteria bacterium]|nr:UDP-N-acetylglucosamine 2-epimerase (hydrolyzing) [Alphaproteobacteria bacterium]
MSAKKKILFLTGTRADFGKIKPLIRAVEADQSYESLIFATGMHTLKDYGYTVDEIYKEGFGNVHVFVNQFMNEPMDLVLANTISGLSRYVHQERPDLMIIHGDRVEALAAAIVGALNNILTVHVEGGELSGTIDEHIRHAISKLVHIHMVANDEARNRLIQMGENPQSVYVIGSPDIDVMLSDELPDLPSVKSRYEIDFEEYAIGLYHPVTTEVENLDAHASAYVEALLDSNLNYVTILPNNDEGTFKIFRALERLKDNPKFRVLPSLRFEYFLTLLKHAQFIIGNSSAAIREAPVYATPTVNIGTRQRGRFAHESIIDVNNEKKDILQGIQAALSLKKTSPSHHFGQGNSAKMFMQTMSEERFWQTSPQKSFYDLPYTLPLKTGAR